MVRLQAVRDGVVCDTMTLDELATRLGISLTSAYERAARDELPVPRVPGLPRYRYSRRLYDRLMETGTIDGPADDGA